LLVRALKARASENRREPNSTNKKIEIEKWRLLRNRKVGGAT
jgi:hypothetical protein